MRSSRLAFAAAYLASTASTALGATGGSFEDGGSTLISAMMMFLGNENSVYILDKAEGNAAQVLGHPAWGSVWDFNTRQTVVQDVRTNVFCASGMHLPNGSYVTFGGNDGVTTNGKVGSQLNPDGTGAWDATYQDFDGRKAIRIVNPCTINDNLNSGNCQWYDEPTVLGMKRNRWYSAAEAVGDGSVIIIGGFVTGGYVNRHYPNVDPAYEGTQAEPTYEYYPPKSGDPLVFNFLIQTSGLNAYAHTFLMPSGKMFVQANLSTILWDHVNNIQTNLPDMPNGVARVYPASGAVAMLPLTPANNYIPTMLFCGGSNMSDYGYGDYGSPYVDTWNVPASTDCQRITPEPADGSTPAYQQDDDMLDARTMGQFILLPNGKVLVINGGLNGTAGYSLGTKTTPNLADMPYGPSLASGPVMTPAIYDPNAAQGSRWSRDGLGTSTIPRLYHSSAILLPDGSVFVAGSNPNPDVNLTTFYPTEYRSEIFYPPYFSASVRPAPTGVPNTLSYGGSYFDITIPSTSYSGTANDAADSAQVVIVRGGFTTHAMNMGQRHLQLNNTYTVFKNGSIVLHVSQAPPNSNIFQPGPALLFVNIHGIPSNGSYLIVGSGQIGTQPVSAVADLPASIRADTTSSGGGSSGGAASSSSSGKKTNMALLIGSIAGAVALFALIGAAVLFFLRRKRREAASRKPITGSFTPPMPAFGMGNAAYESQGRESSVFTPLKKDDNWGASTTDLHAPYKDEAYSMGSRGSVQYNDFDPYTLGYAMQPSGSARSSGYATPQQFQEHQFQQQQQQSPP